MIMNNDFIITGIDRAILVGKDEYDLGVTEFSSQLNYNELIFHFSGRSTVTFGEKQLEVKENTVRFLPKGNFSEYKVNKTEKGECIYVCFTADTSISDEAFVIDIKNNDTVGNLFKKLFSVWVCKNDGYYFECISLLYKIFSELQKQTYIPKSQYNTIRPAVEYIEEHFLDGKISVDMLARKCSVSTSYLKKLFVKKYGMTPLKYILQMKLNHACDLLKTGDYSVGRVAEICGYTDIYYFSRTFKEHMGITPSSFGEKFISSK